MQPAKIPDTSQDTTVQQQNDHGQLMGSHVRSWDAREGQSTIADNGTNLGVPGTHSDSGNPSNPD